MDIYCKVCGEPWDVMDIREEFTEEEKKRFFSGQGCPACKGIRTLYCERCDRFFKGWMIEDLTKEFGTDEVIKLIWKEKTCPYCLSKLKKVEFYEDFFGSVVENDGSVEDVLKINVLDLI